jgi:hypothetical protein
MIELQRSPSHQALASNGSNAYQSTRQGASRMLGDATPSSPPNLVVSSTDSAQCNIAWERRRTDVTSSPCFYRTVYCSPKGIRA